MSIARAVYDAPDPNRLYFSNGSVDWDRYVARPNQGRFAATGTAFSQDTVQHRAASLESG
jgi:hypothetical protein